MDKTLSRRLRLLFVCAMIAITLLLLYKARSIAVPFILGALITYLINPVVVALENKGAKRSLAIILIYILLIMFFSAIVTFLIPGITKELTQLAEILPDQIRKFHHLTDDISRRLPQLPQPIQGVFDDALANFQANALKALRGAVEFILGIASRILDLVLAPIIAFYLTKDLRRIGQGAQGLLPAQYRHELVQAFREMDVVLGGYIRGQLTISAIIMIMVTLGLTLIGVPFSLLLGIIAGMTNIIPYFGAFFGAAPAIFLALLSSPMKAVYVGILFIIVHQLDSGIISPRILGENVGLHPLVVIVSILLGEQLFGPIGLIIGVPLAALLKVALGRIIKLMLTVR